MPVFLAEHIWCWVVPDDLCSFIDRRLLRLLSKVMVILRQQVKSVAVERLLYNIKYAFSGCLFADWDFSTTIGWMLQHFVQIFYGPHMMEPTELVTHLPFLLHHEGSNFFQLLKCLDDFWIYSPWNSVKISIEIIIDNDDSLTFWQLLWLLEHYC